MKSLKRIIWLMAMCLVVLTGNVVHAEDAYIIIEGGEDMSDATGIQIGKTYATPISENGDLYFKFTTKAQKGFYYFYSKEISDNAYDIDIRLIDRVSDVMIDHSDFYQKEYNTNVSLETSATYYIKITAESGATGNVKFSLAYAPDYVGDTKTTAKKVNLGSMISGSLDGSDDEDYYAITTNADTKYVFYGKNISVGYGTEIKLLNGIDEKLCDYDFYTGGEQKEEIELLPNTTYYVRVYNRGGGTGNYKFQLTPKNIPVKKPNKALKIGSTYTDKTTRAKYLVTSKNTMAYVKPTGKYASYIIPATIKAKGKTYKVTAISSNAFKRNTKIKKLTIGRNISKIGQNAFYGCKNLKSITIKTTKLKTSKVEKNAFKGINKRAQIKVPAKKVTSYRKLFRAKGLPKSVKVKK